MDARWIWACKKFDSSKAEINLQSGFYYQLKNEGRDQVLAFRYVVEPQNLPIPEGIFPVKDSSLLQALDDWQKK